MAIIDNSQKEAGITTATQGSQFNMDTNNAIKQQQQPGSQALSFRNLANIAQAPLGRFAGSELIGRFQKALVDIYKELETRYEIKLIPLDNQNNRGLAFGCLVVCVRDKTKANVGVGVHTLILEGTSEPIPPRVEQHNNQQIEILRPASAAWDKVLYQKVVETVSEAYPNSRVLMADANVVPRTFNLENPNSVYSLARNTVLAASTEIDTRTAGFTDMSLENLEKGNLVVNLRVEKKQILDDVGLPMRSNIQFDYIDNSSSGNNRNDQSVNTAEKAIRIGNMSGFVDFAWAPVAQQNQFMMAQYGQFQQMPNGLAPTQKYAARLVLTQITPEALSTLPAVINLIATSTAAAENMNWVQAFFNKGDNRGMHDIGALNIEANIRNNPTGGEKIDTSTDDFRPEELYQLLSVLVRPGLSIAVDVPDCGAQTWYSSVLAASANGSHEATNLIIQAANHLTGGHFGRNFPTGTPLFIDLGNRVHMGYYTNKNGVQEDVRGVDYLAVLNQKGVTNPELVRMWSDTFTATAIPLNERLDRRARIIREIVPTVVFTGFATRCTFSNEALAALSAGIAACGVRPTIQTNGMGVGMVPDRGVAGFANGGLVMPGQVNMYNYGSPTAVNGYGGQAGFNGRFNG